MSTSNQQIPVFVLSLARAKERRAAICRHLESLAVHYQLIDAVDGSALDPLEMENMLGVGIRLHSGAVGCYLSHLAIYERIRDHNLGVALVLEDDARIHPGVCDLLREGISFREWDYCFLDCDDHDDTGPIFYDADSGVSVSSRFIAYELSAGPHTTHAYLISRSAALKRLVHAFPIQHPIDVYRKLPYPIKFYSILSPKGAWVSEHSLESFASTKKTSPEKLSFKFLRRWPMFFRIRDVLTLRSLRRWLLTRSLLADGKLPKGKRWRMLPSGREIIVGR